MAQPDILAALRHRLLAVRDELIAQLAEADVLDAGRLALLGDVGAALDQLEFPDSCPPRRRGGDHNVVGRVQRNSGVQDLAQLLGADLSLEARARVVIKKHSNYRPSPSDANGSAERQALHRIASSGVPLPKSTKQVKRIISKK